VDPEWETNPQKAFFQRASRTDKGVSAAKMIVSLKLLDDPGTIRKESISHPQYIFLYIFLATHLLMSPHFVFLRDFWIRTQRAAVASRRATNLATHLRNNSNMDPDPDRSFFCEAVLGQG
jgi:hypothetical protein